MSISNVGSAENTYFSATALNTRTVTVDIGSRTNGLIGVNINVLAVAGAGGDITGVTWNGTALSKAVETSSTSPFADIWWLPSPTGGSHDVVVSFAGTPPGSGVIGFQIVIFWCDSDVELELGDISTVAAGGADPTSIDVVTTQAGSLVISGYASNDNNVAVTSETLLQDYDAGGDIAGASYLIAGAAGTQTMDWNRSPTGQSSVFNIAGAAFEEPDTGSPPTVALDTADESTINDSTPTLLFTGTDAESDDIRYEIQISDNPDLVTGSQLQDNLQPGAGLGGLVIHPNPATSETTWLGDIQVDDRPGQSFMANGGILDKALVYFGAHETSPADTDGTAYVRVYAHQGVYGTSSEPLNPAAPEDTPTPNWLAISDAFPFSPGAAGKAWRQFDFSGANRVRLMAGQKYVLILDWLPVNRITTNTVAVDADSINSGAAHAGNLYIDGIEPANNGVQVSWDLFFEVYEVGLLLDKVSGTDAGFANQDNGADTDPFTSGDQIGFTVQAGDILDDGLYYWRVRGIDPSGSNTWGDWTTARTFTIQTTGGVVNFAAVAQLLSAAPDDSLLAVVRSGAVAILAASASPDTSLSVLRGMLAEIGSISAARDGAALDVIRTMAAIMAATSAAPENVLLDISGMVEFLAACQAQSSTPDDGALAVLRSMAAIMAAASAAPEDVLLDISGMVEFLAACQAQSSTPDDGALAVLRSMASAAQAASSTPDGELLIALGFVAQLAAASSTGDADLAVLRSLAAGLSASSFSPDASLSVLRQAAASIQPASQTPDDVTLAMVVIVGLVRASFAVRKPGSGFAARQPGVSISGRKPGISFEE